MAKAKKRRNRYTGADEWYAREQIGGERHVFVASTKTELEDQLTELREQHRRERYGLAPSRRRGRELTFDQACDLYLASYAGLPRSKRSIEERLKLARAKFGETRLRTLTPELIGQWVASGMPKLTPNGRVMRLAAVRRVLKWAVELGYVASDPSAKIRGPRQQKRPVTPFESWEDVAKVASHARPPYGSLILFSCATGLRPQEWQALRWEDIDAKGKTLTIRQTVRDGKIEPFGKTDGSLRTVQLSQIAADALAALPQPIKGGLIFGSPNGGLIDVGNFRRRVWQPALDAADLPRRSIDQTRHTFAVLSLLSGTRIQWVSKQLGHCSITTTLRFYASWLEDDHAPNIAALDAATAGLQWHSVAGEVSGADA
jgi:integrase